MKQLTSLLCLVLIPLSAFGYTRIWYEDCEDTEDAYFLMDQYSPTTSTHDCDMQSGALLQSAITQSSTSPRAGTYSMVWDLDAECGGGNPYATLGRANGDGYTTYTGFTNSYDFTTVNARYWYFRWYVRWNSMNWGESTHILKHIYINYGNSEKGSQFYLMLQQLGGYLTPTSNYNSLAIALVEPDATRIISEDSTGIGTFSELDITDGEWHKFELYLDTGTGSNSDGVVRVTIDDEVGINVTGTRFHVAGASVDSNPIKYIQTWPGNTATGPSGDLYLDDLEIYTLTGPTDIPPELGSESSSRGCSSNGCSPNGGG